MAYGDILEINGQFVEHTPVGYMPLSPERAEGMLTKPAPITKTTTPTQTLPIGTPTTDPNKAPAGETGGFDPNGGPIGSPSTTVTAPPVAVLPPAPATVEVPPPVTPVKPLPDVKENTQVVENVPEMTFTFVEGRESGDAQQNYLYGQTGETQQATVEQLRSYFENDEVNRLSEQFGSFDNYLAYMTEREQLIQSGDYDVGNWSEADTGFTEDQQMIFEGDADLTIDASDPGQDITNLTRQVRNTQAGAYNNWLNSEANQALLEKYGVSGTVYSESGDKFQWNGSAYVKVVDEDKVSMGDYARMAMGVAVGSMLGPALGNLATGATTAGTAAGTAAATTAGSFAQGAVNATLGSAISQGIATGSVDASQLVVAGITGGIGGVVDAVNAGDLVGTEIDNAIWDLSDQLNIAPAEVTEILQGAVNGAITGADVESIVQGAVSGYTTGKIKSTLNGLYGSEIDVENVFDEGTTSIATASLDPFIETAVDAAFEGEIQGEDVLEALLDFATYEDELGYEGSLAFLDPTKAFGEDSDLFGDTPQFIKEIEDVARTGATYVRDVGRDVRDAVPEFNTPQPVKEIEDTLRSGAAYVRDVGRDIREAIPSGTTPDIDLPSVDLPSLSGGLLGGSGGTGGTIQKFKGVDPGGINYDPRTQFAMIQQPNKQETALDQITSFLNRQGKGMLS